MKKQPRSLAYSFLVFAGWLLLVYGALVGVPTTTLAQFYGGGSCPPPPPGCASTGCQQVCQTNCSKICIQTAIRQGASCSNQGC